MLSGRLGQGMQNPYVGYSSMRGGLVTFAPPPPAPPECWHESYAPLDIEQNGANQLFYSNVVSNYRLGCDALLQKNGVFMDPFDYVLPYQDVDFNLQITAYLMLGDWVSIEPITNAEQDFWLQEFYWTVRADGRNQVYSDPSLMKWAGSRTLSNTNLSLNGVLLTMGVDYTYDPTIGITFYCQLETDDVVGILPTCAGPSLRAIRTPLIPQLVFIAVATGRNQTYTDNLLTGYSVTTDCIITKDGVVLEPEVDYSLDGNTLTVFVYTRAMSEIIVLANSRSCTGFNSAFVQTQGFDLLLTQGDDFIITEDGL